MNRHVNTIGNRLSLRTPQRDSLEILARVCDIIDLEKNTDVEKAIEIIKSEFPTVEDFERKFPSLCFALATGVGKTRLMGAFITYLYRVKGVRHFFVLAPNLTIYNKLIADFTPNTPKYVFKGIAEFSINQPLLITGDNYASGAGIRKGNLFDTEQDVHINIFNISKINSEVRGGNAPRIKRLSEYIGESYFDYLAGLDDLVMIMDEAHRYRASAGINAINELNPILGLELTATAQIEQGTKTIPFNNVIYSYPLSNAMDDGYVKEPAVATRENFNKDSYDNESLEKLKLQDGVRIHENTKIELEVYARENDKPLVKPFMLVVAQDTTHANDIVNLIESDDFFEGRYKGKIIQVHSAQRGEEKDDVVEKLLSVESPDNPVEIVVHVNMLKEGWDVTNLYTIVPLRAANSKTLVEQSIGRGLRLPYGKRTGNAAVDRLTIVSHDRFQDIVDHANDPNSIIRSGIVIGKDIPDEKMEIVTASPNLLSQIESDDNLMFKNKVEQKIALTTIDVINTFQRKVKSSSQLKSPEIREQIQKMVVEIIKPVNGELGFSDDTNVTEIVEKAIELHNSLTIDIPKIVVVPTGDVTCGYNNFDLDVSNIKLQPVENDILIRHLHDHKQYKMKSETGKTTEKRLEDYLVRGLIVFNDISYDNDAELLYKLSGQLVEHLKSYLKDDAVVNVLQYYQDTLVNLIHSQMQEHYEETATKYEASVTKGFIQLRNNNYTAVKDSEILNFRAPVENKQGIKKMLFGGFSKCLYPIQKFDSDSERRFAVCLENEVDVLKWAKPARKQFEIYYNGEEKYEPDFVVETKDSKLLCEVKKEIDIDTTEVQAKATAAMEWCKNATNNAIECGDKPWKYLLVPHNEIDESKTLLGFVSRYSMEF